jgi:hypothetical protein
MFHVLGVLIGIYTVYAAMAGRVYAKSGPFGRTVVRDESPRYFWVVIVIYAGLTIALLFVF